MSTESALRNLVGADDVSPEFHTRARLQAMQARVAQAMSSGEGDLSTVEVAFYDAYFDPTGTTSIPVAAESVGMKKTVGTRLVNSGKKLEAYMRVLEERKAMDPRDREKWAISRLLEGAPFSDVCRETGVHRTTLSRWMGKDEWRPLLMEARIGAEMHGIVHRLRAGEEAVDLLLDLMRDGRQEGARVAAGQAILKAAYDKDATGMQIDTGPSKNEIAAYLQLVVSWVGELVAGDTPRERIPSMLLERITGSVDGG